MSFRSAAIICILSGASLYSHDASASSFLMASFGANLEFQPNLPAAPPFSSPAKQGCTFFNGAPGGEPATASGGCALEYVNAGGDVSRVEGSGSASADFNGLAFLASASWTDFAGPANFSTPSYLPASVGAGASSKWEGEIHNPSQTDFFSALLSVTYTMHGTSVSDLDGLTRNAFSGLMSGRVTLSEFGNPFQFNADCNIRNSYGESEGSITSTCVAGMPLQLAAGAKGMLSIQLDGGVNLTQSTSIFPGSGNSTLLFDGLHTASITSVSLTDLLGNAIALSSLNITSETGAMLTEAGLVLPAADPGTDAVPEPGTIVLALSGGVALMRRARSRTRA